MWWLAGGIFLLAYASAVVPRTQAQGWVGAVPTPTLVCLRPWVSPDDLTAFDRQADGIMTALGDELRRRDGQGEVAWLWQRVWLARTRLGFALDGRSGLDGADLATLDWLDETRLAAPGATLADTLATLRRDHPPTVVVHVESSDSEAQAVDPSSIPAPIAGLRLSTTLDSLTSRGVFTGAFSLSWWEVHGGAVHVHVGAEQKDETRFDTYDVTAAARACLGTLADMPGATDWTLSQVVDIVGWFVTPDRWWDNGGDLPGARALGGRLALVAPTRAHTRVRALLAALTQARQNAPACAGAGEGDAELATRVIDLNLGPIDDPERTAVMIRARLGVPCVVDHAAASVSAASSRSPSAPRLDAWTVRDGVVILTTTQARAAYAFIRVYDASHLAEVRYDTEFWRCLLGGPIPTPPDRRFSCDLGPVMDHLTRDIEPDAWMENGGDTAYARSLGTKIIVLAPAPMHAQIERLLATLTPRDLAAPDEGAPSPE
ncbi:MAG: hypothetical protein HBSAPP03_10070 [Phycisphaerae bacterium]|nr:MAG: hypothetical protein HBSAPP03_10070 [Phycisphaerae bacterium]